MLYQAAYQSGNPQWHAQFRPGVGDAELDRVEQQLGQLLPEEARRLYAWHDGAISAIAPDLSFSPLAIAFATGTAIAKFPLPPLSNGPTMMSSGALFPVFNIERVLFNVVSTPPPAPRSKSSGVYVLDFERNHLTQIALSLRVFIEHLIEELEAGNAIYTEHGVRWKRDPYRFDPTMEPYGSDRRHSD